MNSNTNNSISTEEAANSFNTTQHSGRLYKLADVLESKHPNLTRSKQVDAVVCYILENEKCISKENTLTTGKLIQKYKDLKQTHPNVFDIPDNSIATYTSNLANNVYSKISCEGKKRGYYLNIVSNNISGNTNKKVKEIQTYPILESWLSLQCGRVKNISNSKKGSQWGNPDIIGINHSVFFGNNIIEVTTIEAKRSLEHWRTNFFEAVSHSMFANKAYFAYLCKQSDKIERDLLLYAQQFGIGIIAIEIPDNEWKDELMIKMEYVKEIFPAPAHEVNIDRQKEFLNNLDIYEITDLAKFGKSSQELVTQDEI